MNLAQICSFKEIDQINIFYIGIYKIYKQKPNLFIRHKKAYKPLKFKHLNNTTTIIY